jgi:RES domain-containing protein
VPDSTAKTYDVALSFAGEDHEDSLPNDWREPFQTGTVTTQQIGSEWATSRQTCILSVPSRNIPDERILLLNPNHPEFENIQIVHYKPVSFD